MAKAKAKKDAGGADGSKGGAGGLVVLVLMTLIGAGVGAGYKLYVLDAQPAPAADVAGTGEIKGEQGKASGAPGADGAAESDKRDEIAAGMTLERLPPIVADLAGEPKRWLRIEASLVFAGEPEGGYAVVVQEASADFLSYLRTVSLAQIEGPEGLEYLTEDLEELAQIRSNGTVSRIIINSLVTE